MSEFLTVIIPVHNGSAFIHRALHSVSRELPKAKVIVVENGSSDKSIEILKQIIDSKVLMLSQPEANKCRARNAGAVAANTRFITFLDQDDEITAARADYLEYLENHEWDVVVGTQKFVLSEAKMIPPYFKSVIDSGNPLYHPITLVIERKKYLELGGFNEKHRFAEDFEFMTRVNEKSLKVKYSEKSSLIRHFHENNDSRNIESSRQELFKVLRARAHRATRNT